MEKRLSRFFHSMMVFGKHLRALGLFRGIFVYFQTHFILRLRNAEIGIWVPAVAARIWLRPQSSDTTVFEQIFVYREYEIRRRSPQYHDIRALESQVKAEAGRSIVIDCGANIGLSTLWFAKEFPQSTIYAIEPSDDNFRILSRNVAHLENVVPLKAAIWDRPASLRIKNPQSKGWAFRMGEAEAGRAASAPIQGITINQIMQSANVPSLLVVKIDIEGGEAELFRANTEWMDATSLLIIELHDHLFPWQARSHNFLSEISSRMFDCVLQGEYLFCFRHGPPALRLPPVVADRELELKFRGVAMSRSE